MLVFFFFPWFVGLNFGSGCPLINKKNATVKNPSLYGHLSHLITFVLFIPLEIRATPGHFKKCKQKPELYSSEFEMAEMSR